MSALLAPLAKGFLSLMGISSFMFVSVRNDVELQIQEMELEAAEFEHAQRDLKLEAVPEKK
jgi:hypothetical protein